MDEQLLFLINRQWTSPGADWFMSAICSWAVWMVPVFVLATGVAVWGGFRGRAALAVIALAVSVGEGLFANPLKALVGRPRPHEVLADVRQVRLEKTRPAFLGLFRPAKTRLSRPEAGEAGGNSFPSSHTLNHFAIATVLASVFRRWGWLWFLPATLIGYARVYTGSHWPSDVLASALLGGGLGLLAVGVVEWGWRRFVAARFPGRTTLFAGGAR